MAFSKLWNRPLSLFLYFSVSVLLILSNSVNGQLDVIKWCTSSAAEQEKCTSLSEYVDQNLGKFGNIPAHLQCVQAFNKAECMQKLDENQADLTSLDPGNVFIGGRYHSLLPIMQEVYKNNQPLYHSVAVIKRDSLPEVQSLADLNGTKACFPGVGVYGGWVQPIYTLMKQKVMKIADCNNHVKSAMKFFGKSCAVDSLADIYNPLGDNSGELCELCAGQVAGEYCTSKDPYAGYQGAFRCLVNSGQIAFLKHNTVEDMLKTGKFGNLRVDNFELLCLDGTRRPIAEYRSCNWGDIPSDAIVTTSAKSVETRSRYQKFLQKLVELFGANTANAANTFRNSSFTTNGFTDFRQNNVEETVSSFPDFRLFDSSRFGQHGNSSFPQQNLMFQDDTVSLQPLTGDKQTYSGYLGRALDAILGIRDCQIKSFTLCVTSDAEFSKCTRMRTAMKAQLLQPDMKCHKSGSDMGCMQDIRRGIADVTMLDAGDVYTAGLKYDLVPILSEVYNLGEPEYYVVAVAKARDPTTELIYLKNKNTCHTGVQHAAGWIIPMAYLLANQHIRNYGCDSLQSAASFFTKACVPGAMNPEYSQDGRSYQHMCDLCHGSSFKFCRRDHSEDYFGNTGAFRCLVEGGGHVAFVRHTTVLENTDGKSREYWSRNQLSRDYELLCRDGQRAPVTDYERCYLGKVKSNAMVTRGGNGYNQTEIDAYVNVFMYAQQYYGLKGQNLDFSLFTSDPPYNDLIFQDATLKLQVVPEEDRHYSEYLGPEFLQARALVDCKAGSNAVKATWSLTAGILLTILFAR